jgi:hypothetical protein
MWAMNDILLKVRIFGAFRASTTHQLWTMCRAMDVESGLPSARMVLEGRMGIDLLLKSLGLEVEGDPLAKHPLDLDAPVEIMLANCLPGDRLVDLIADAFGNEASVACLWAQQFVTAYILADMFGFLKLAGTPAHRKSVIKEQRELAGTFLKVVGERIEHDRSSIITAFGAEVHSLAKALAVQLQRGLGSPRWFSGVRELCEPLVNCLVPGYTTIEERLNRAMDLRMQLVKCPPGRENWRNYEDICVKILRFAFVPPFRTVIAQVRNLDGYERRDAVLPNNQYDGFWAALRDEFQSRHIVCEFKNRSRLGKDALNQLRIYLEKPSVGRFGLLFARQTTGKSLKRAQRDAYEQAKILILILNDEMLVDLLFCRSFLGNAEEVLEREKISFEVNY